MPDRDPVLVALGDALRSVRLEQGMSQEALGLATGVHRNYIGGVERGERQPTVAVIARLAATMDCKLSDLFTRAEAFCPEDSDDPDGLIPTVLPITEGDAARGRPARGRS